MIQTLQDFNQSSKSVCPAVQDEFTVVVVNGKGHLSSRLTTKAEKGSEERGTYKPQRQ